MHTRKSILVSIYAGVGACLRTSFCVCTKSCIWEGLGLWELAEGLAPARWEMYQINYWEWGVIPTCGQRWLSLRPSSPRITGFETNEAAFLGQPCLVALTDVAAKAVVVESICSEPWEFGCLSGLLCMVVLRGWWACRLHTTQLCVQEPRVFADSWVYRTQSAETAKEVRDLPLWPKPQMVHYPNLDPNMVGCNPLPTAPGIPFSLCFVQRINAELTWAQ